MFYSKKKLVESVLIGKVAIDHVMSISASCSVVVSSTVPPNFRNFHQTLSSIIWCPGDLLVTTVTTMKEFLAVLGRKIGVDNYNPTPDLHLNFSKKALEFLFSRQPPRLKNCLASFKVEQVQVQ